jgi:hypothetical protein
VDCASWSACEHLFCLSTPQLSNDPWSLLKYHPISVLDSCVPDPVACPFYLVWLSTTVYFLVCQVVKQVRGGEETVHIEVMTLFFKCFGNIIYCGMGSCHILCCTVSLFLGIPLCHIPFENNSLFVENNFTHCQKGC